MTLLYCCVIALVNYSYDQLSLSQSHLVVEASSVHGLRVKVATIANVPVHPEGSLDGYINCKILSPSVMSPTPKVVLIIKNNTDKDEIKF